MELGKAVHYMVTQERVGDSKKEKMLLALRSVDLVCQTNDIKYFLMYGSLIGAIRHKGIIPWDDDIDIAMLRDDYDKFLRLCPIKDCEIEVKEQELDSSFPYYYAKVCIKGTHLYEYIDGEKYDVGIGIDLFPLDDFPDGILKRRKLLRSIKNLRTKLIPHTIDRSQKRIWYKQVLLKMMDVVFRKKAFQYVGKLKEEVSLSRQPNSRLVVEIMTPYGERGIFPRDWFRKVVRVPFEGMTVSIPKEYDLILKQLYGDYMTPPPEEKRVTHHSTYEN